MADQIKRIEARSLTLAMWGNLVMAAMGLGAGLWSNSGAVLLDGLFSLIGFFAALVGRRVGLRSDTPPDRDRPFGYAAEEAIFSTFRALSLLGLILFAVANALRTIFNTLSGVPAEPLLYGPMIGYFILIGVVCALLWVSHFLAWRRTGRQSAILRLEMKAAFFDGLITVSAGAGLAAIYVLRDGALAGIAPIGDSLIVLLLCLAAAVVYLGDFRGGLRELASASALPKHVATARRALRPAIAEDGGTLRDLSVVKLGRTFLLTAYYDPGRPLIAREVDALNLRLIRDARAALPGADVLLLVTEHPRRWPDELDPYG
ncbi:cation transporter [Palleronia sp. LCG004]|uniref:cation transporter n=1 Tax=Palleronia sp. LCG004 TaxID=3079304 RepID=UPI002943A946|nr:cation transporter [Palleronia sp. LCG004]WOI57930.1 cation transporter [Palleronia sp. LCG004]